MDEDNDDVIAVESSSGMDDMENEKPLMCLLKRLVGNNQKPLTNAQIILILEKEFDISVSSLHNLEQIVYTNVVKKFLKDWPSWDVFDEKLQVLKHNKDDEGLKRLLESKYRNLRMYVKTMLDVAEPLVQKTIQEIKESEKEKEKAAAAAVKEKDTNDVVMEVVCSRSQLHTLFNNRPTSDGALFNITTVEPSRIRICHVPYKSLLNWWGFSINITINSVTIRRETCHQLNHLLVNMTRTVPEPSEPLNKNYQEKVMPSKQNIFRRDLLKVINDFKHLACNTEISYVVNLLDIIIMDLKHAPVAMKVPGVYRQHMGAYPYVRYLYTEVGADTKSEEAKKYDIRLQETISPMFQLWLGRVSSGSTVNTVNDIFIECKECKLKFGGDSMLPAVEQHFLEVHSIDNEPDWTCVRCKHVFTMAELGERRWEHLCKPKTKEGNK